MRNMENSLANQYPKEENLTENKVVDDHLIAKNHLELRDFELSLF